MSSRRKSVSYNLDEVRELYNKKYYYNEELGNIEVDILKRDFFNKEETKLTEAQELLFKEVYSRLDAITGRHQIGVVINTKAILDENPGLGLDEKTMLMSAALHDIGKTIISPDILQYSGKYEGDNDPARIKMDKHSTSTQNVFNVIVGNINKKYNTNYNLDDFFDTSIMRERVIDICSNHHFAGVKNIQGPSIPINVLESNIIQKADIFEAISSPLRPYTPIKDDIGIDKAFEANEQSISTFLTKHNLKKFDININDDTFNKMYHQTTIYNDNLEPFILNDYSNIAKRENTTIISLLRYKKGLENNQDIKKQMNITTNFDFSK